MVQSKGVKKMFHINGASGKAIYEQIMEQVKEAVFKEYLKPGDSLPSVRKLALTLSVTPNTVAKAYQLLEKEKIIVTIRGKGAFIAKNISYEMDLEKLNRIKEDIRGSLVEMKYLGFDETETIKLIQDIYVDLEGERNGNHRN